MNRTSGTARHPYIINPFGENVGGLDEYKRQALRRALIDMIIREGNMDDYDLPCGCYKEDGRQCKVARELWEQVQAAYWKANRLEGTWDEYARLHTEYLAHFKEQQEMAEVAR